MQYFLASFFFYLCMTTKLYQSAHKIGLNARENNMDAWEFSPTWYVLEFRWAWLVSCCQWAQKINYTIQHAWSSKILLKIVRMTQTKESERIRSRTVRRGENDRHKEGNRTPTLSKVKTLSICFPAMVCLTATSLWSSLHVSTCGALLRNSSSLIGLRIMKTKKSPWFAD